MSAHDSPIPTIAVALTLMLLALVASVWRPGSLGLSCSHPASRSTRQGIWGVRGPSRVSCQGSGVALKASSALLLGRKLDLNQASAQDLAAIPGLSLETARNVITFRKQNHGFTTVLALEKVSGIGPRTRSKLQHYLYVSRSPRR